MLTFVVTCMHVVYRVYRMARSKGVMLLSGMIADIIAALLTPCLSTGL